MKTNIQSGKKIKPFLFDKQITDNIFLALDKIKVEKNCDNYKGHFLDINGDTDSIYAIASYSFGKHFIITFLKDGETIESQFLVSDPSNLDELDIKDLSQYVNYEIADMFISYFGY